MKKEPAKFIETLAIYQHLLTDFSYTYETDGALEFLDGQFAVLVTDESGDVFVGHITKESIANDVCANLFSLSMWCEKTNCWKGAKNATAPVSLPIVELDSLRG